MARVLITYESMFGNTREIAVAISDGLRSVPGVEVALHEVGVAPTSLTDFDLVVVGAPTHALSLSRPGTRADAATRSSEPLVSPGTGLREWLAVVDPGPNPPVAATFDTRIKKAFLPGSAAKAARRRLARRRVRCIDSQSFWVADLLGPLRPGELERARRWGVSLTAAVDLQMA